MSYEVDLTATPEVSGAMTVAIPRAQAQLVRYSVYAHFVRALQLLSWKMYVGAAILSHSALAVTHSSLH